MSEALLCPECKKECPGGYLLCEHCYEKLLADLATAKADNDQMSDLIEEVRQELADMVDGRLEGKLQDKLDKHRWIPVEERLPEARNKDTEWSEKVQVYHVKHRHVDHDWYLTEQKRWQMRPLAPYTHWRPIYLSEGE